MRRRILLLLALGTLAGAFVFLSSFSPSNDAHSGDRILAGTQSAHVSVPKEPEIHEEQTGIAHTPGPAPGLRGDRSSVEQAGYDQMLASPDKALARLKEMFGEADRAAFVRGMFSAAATLDIHEGIRFLKQIDSESAESGLAMQALAEAWRGGLPYKPPDFYVNPARFLGKAGEIGRWLAQGRMDAAEAWANEYLTNESERVAVLAAVAGKSYKDPRRSEAIYAQLSAEQRAEFLEQYSLQFVPGWYRARDIVRYLPEGDLQTAAWSKIAPIFGKFSEAFAREVYDQIPLGAGRAPTLAGLAEGWARRDYSGALSWAELLPTGEREIATSAIRALKNSPAPPNK